MIASGSSLTRADAGEKIKSTLEQLHGGVLDEHLLINAVTAELQVGQLHALAARSDVMAVSIDAPLQAGADNVGTLAENMLLPTLGLIG